jgi:hypothetical protein
MSNRDADKTFCVCVEREKSPADSAMSTESDPTEAEARGQVESEVIAETDPDSKIAVRDPTQNEVGVEVKRKSGILNWIKTLCLVLPAVILGWIRES